MRKLVYYVAATADGFIAGPEGQFDFLLFESDIQAMIITELPETLPGPARVAMGIDDVANQRFDAVVMGRGTYEPGLAAGMTSPYPQLRQYVFSRTLAQLDPAVQVVATDPAEFVRQLKQDDGRDIWLCGGATLAAELLDEIDELIIKRNPIVIGAGIPLFRGPFVPTKLVLAGARPLSESGVVIETYVRS